MQMLLRPSESQGLLYDPRYEHDACGVGFIADINGNKSYNILELAIEAVVNLTHRGAVDADAKTGDGAGILTQIPRKLFKREIISSSISSVKSKCVTMRKVFSPNATAFIL